jgi:hypothetical protein
MSQAADGTMPATLRLEYASTDSAAPPAGRSRWRVMSLIALSSGLILPFLPMDCDVSAVKVVWKGGVDLLGGQGMDREGWALWFLALPYFLIYPLIVWKVRQLAGRRRPRPRVFRATALTLGALGAAALLGMLTLMAWHSNRSGPSAEYWIFVVGPTVGLMLVGVLEAVLLMRPGRWDDQVTVALVGPYAVTLTVCVIAWSNGHQFGWYFALTPAAAGLVELIVITRSLWLTRAARTGPTRPMRAPSG